MTPVHVDSFHGTWGLLLYWHGTQSNRGSFETGCIHGMSTNLSFLLEIHVFVGLYQKSPPVNQHSHGKSTILMLFTRNNGGFSMVMLVYRRVGGLESAT